MYSILKSEILLLAALLAGVLGYLFEHSLLEAGQAMALAGAALLVGAIVLASMRVAHHAEVLAARVGDPYGTMILTLSAVLVEVIILAILMTKDASPTLVRDTIYAAVMIDINGILGLAALLGGIKHGEQSYNDDSSRTYSVMILTAMGISMVVPEFIPQAKWHFYSAFTIVAMVTLYAVFLRMQVGAHSYFFSYSYPKGKAKAEEAPLDDAPYPRFDHHPCHRGDHHRRTGGGDVGAPDRRSQRYRRATGAGRDRGGGNFRRTRDPDGASGGARQPHAGRGQHRARRIAVDGDPHRARHGRRLRSIPASLSSWR